MSDNYRPPKDGDARILGIDDDAGVRHLIGSTLKYAGFKNVTLTDSLRIGFELLAEGNVDLLLLDWEMPNVTGIEILMDVRPRMPKLPIIMLTSINDQKKVMKAIENGCTDYVIKPWKSDELLEKIRMRLITRHNLSLPVNNNSGFI
ncbi:MAG: response regulator [Bdellovibrionales bacterium]|nr:response regulator [Bdellovibrionales bacterium]